MAAFGEVGEVDGFGASDRGDVEGRCAAAMVGFRAGLAVDGVIAAAGAAALAGAAAEPGELLLLIPLPPCLPIKHGKPKAIAAAWISVAVAFAIPTGCNPASLKVSTNSPNKTASNTSPPFPAASVRTPPRGKGCEVIHSPRSTTIGAHLK